MKLGMWVLFEERLRQVNDVDTLQLLVVNLLQKVFPYHQAVLFQRQFGSYKTKAASDISQINEHSPTIHWLNEVVYPWLDSTHKNPSYFNLTDLKEPINDYYQSNTQGLYLPLYSKHIGDWGVVFWMKEKGDEELLNFSPVIINTIIYSWEKVILQKTKSRHLAFTIQDKKYLLFSSIIIFIVLFLFRVPESTIALAEISPKSPELITSSINGTVNKIEVEPNQPVQVGQALIQLDEITVKSQLDESLQALHVAEEKYKKAFRHAFTDEKSRQEMQVLKAETEQAQANYEYHRELLNRTLIKSTIAGVALYSDPKDWLGKPVRIGEKIMLVANPHEKEVTFWVSMDNMIIPNAARPPKFYPNENPLKSTTLELKYINPIAELRPDNTLAYFGVAKLPSNSDVRLGEQGTIKIYGNRVSVFYYFFRRPIRYLRQNFGI
jgi:hypothetical protein